MPITDLTRYAAIDAAFDEQIKRIEFALIRTLKYVGEECVNAARNAKEKTYKDQTGNLRSSVGAIVSVDGKIEWQTSFEVVKQGGQGATEGAAFAKALVSKFPKGIALIVVAGKNYAVHVSNRGYDVLTSAELEANSLVPKMLASLKL